MDPDPIVQEVRAAREAYAAKFNFDLHAICRDLMEKERVSGQRVVSFAPRSIEPQPVPPITRPVR